jgi:hypothetical protein
MKDISHDNLLYIQNLIVDAKRELEAKLDSIRRLIVKRDESPSLSKQDNSKVVWIRCFEDLNDAYGLKGFGYGLSADGVELNISLPPSEAFRFHKDFPCAAADDDDGFMCEDE